VGSPITEDTHLVASMRTIGNEVGSGRVGNQQVDGIDPDRWMSAWFAARAWCSLIKWGLRIASVLGNVIRRTCFLISASDLLRVVRTRPLVSVAVSGDRYSVGYSVAHGHVVSDSRLRSP
jgi:hypothetical protein